jgi:hypothetical protein
VLGDASPSSRAGATSFRRMRPLRLKSVSAAIIGPACCLSRGRTRCLAARKRSRHSASSRSRSLAASRTCAACSLPTTTTPSASPSTMSPGRTAMPPQLIGWFTGPSRRLSVPLIERPRAKTGKPSCAIVAPSRTKPSTTRPAAPCARACSVSRSPQGPPSQAPRSPRRAPAGPPTPPTAPRFGVSGQERLDREVRRGDLERRSESGDDREEADVAQRRARLKRNHRLGGGAIRWLRWQVGLDLVDQLPERLVRVLAALALEPVDQRGVAGRGRRGDARQAARVHGEAQHVDRRLEQCRVDPLPEEGGGAVDIRGMVIATRREATVRSGAVASAGSPVRAPSDGTYLGCQAGGAVR